MCPILHISITLWCICFLPAFRICQSMQNELIHCYHPAGNWLCLVPISAPPNASINKVCRKVVLLGSSYTKGHLLQEIFQYGRCDISVHSFGIFTCCHSQFCSCRLVPIHFPKCNWNPQRFVNQLYWSEMTEETKEKIYHVHDYIGTGIIYKRNKQLQ